MPMREMKIDRGLFEIAMAEEHLDGAQVGPSFQHVRGKAMTQSVGMDVPVLKTGSFGGVPAGQPDNLGVDGMARGAPASTGKQPCRRLVLESAPVDAQRIEQLRAEHDVAVLAALAATDVDDHPLAVDVADLQMCHLRPAGTGGIQGHQQNAIDGCLCCIDQMSDFFPAEHLRQV